MPSWLQAETPASTEVGGPERPASSDHGAEDILVGFWPKINFSHPVNERLVREYWDKSIGLNLG
jgi:hypothetical protein